MAKRKLSIVVVEEHENGDEGVSKPINIPLAYARLWLPKKPPMTKAERSQYDDEDLKALELSNLAEALYIEIQRRFGLTRRRK